MAFSWSRINRAYQYLRSTGIHAINTKMGKHLSPAHHGEIAATAERSQLRRRDRSNGGEMVAAAERWQLLQVCDDEDLSSNSDQRNQAYLKINQKLNEIPSQLNWSFSIDHLFIFKVQSSGRTGSSTRLLTEFTFINIDWFLSLE